LKKKWFDILGKLSQVDRKFIQMEDEIASLGAVIGASLAGVKAMTATYYLSPN